MIHAIVLALASILYVPPAVGPNLSLGVHSGGCGPLKLSRDAVARKAVAGMATLGLRNAGVTPDGHALGYSDAVTVVTLVFSLPDGQSYAMVCAAAWSGPKDEEV